jgi:hypothetical protein
MKVVLGKYGDFVNNLYLLKYMSPGGDPGSYTEERERKYFLRDQCFFIVTFCWHRKACRFCFVSTKSTSSAAIDVTARNISMPLG